MAAEALYGGGIGAILTLAHLWGLIHFLHKRLPPIDPRRQPIVRGKKQSPSPTLIL
jgi:hypothetical protein